MNKYQKNKFTMYHSVRSYLELNSSEFSDNEGFVQHYEELMAMTSEIGVKEDKQLKATSGRTKDKTISRSSATAGALAIAGAIYVFAKKAGNIPLMESVNHSKTGLVRLRDTALLIELRSIRDKAMLYREQISKYGISAGKLELYSDAILSYISSFGNKVNGVAVRTSIISSIGDVMKQTDDILNSLDKLMENYSGEKPDFYAGYRSVRLIRKLGVRHKVDEPPPDNGEPGSAP